MNKRVFEAFKLVRSFELFPKTAREMKKIVNLMEKSKDTASINRMLTSAYNRLGNEFTKSSPFGKHYRMMCFKEIGDIILNSTDRLVGRFAEAREILAPVSQRMHEVRSNLAPVADFFLDLAQTHEQTKPSIYKEVMFHLIAYMYLVTFEGIFDELIRILYFFSIASKNHLPKIAELQKTTIWTIMKKLPRLPSFLKDWDKKRHLRNAIGHARAYYNGENNMIRFVDVDNKKGTIVYDEILSMSEFYKVWTELNDSMQAFVLITGFLSFCMLVWSDESLLET